ncbi:MAG: hypothetical protein IT428_05805 [Planctomycetaceae bacterium]|nr:hypothetical protein [Planctomycetaceae bacterium]
MDSADRPLLPSFLRPFWRTLLLAFVALALVVPLHFVSFPEAWTFLSSPPGLAFHAATLTLLFLLVAEWSKQSTMRRELMESMPNDPEGDDSWAVAAVVDAIRQLPSGRPQTQVLQEKIAATRAHLQDTYGYRWVVFVGAAFLLPLAGVFCGWHQLRETGQLLPPREVLLPFTSGWVEAGLVLIPTLALWVGGTGLFRDWERRMKSHVKADSPIVGRTLSRTAGRRVPTYDEPIDERPIDPEPRYGGPEPENLDPDGFEANGRHHAPEPHARREPEFDDPPIEPAPRPEPPRSDPPRPAPAPKVAAAAPPPPEDDIF